MKQSVYKLVLNGATSATIGSPMLVKYLRNISAHLSVSDLSSESVTVKFAGSLSEDMPDFSASATVSNPWQYIQVVDLDTGDAIDGSTGVTLTSNSEKHYDIQSNNLNWVNAIITSMTGTVTVSCRISAVEN